MNVQEIVVNFSDAGQRIDTFLASKTGITRSQLQKLIESGSVLVNSRIVSQNYRVKTNDVITLTISDKETEGLIPEPIPLEILYKDDYLVVVNKPAGMVVYPSAGHNQGTLMNALSHYCKKLASVGGPLRPGIIHRLDKDTSGVMVVALNDEAYYNLIEQFKQRTIMRRYSALVYGNLKEDKGEIALQIGRSVSDRKKMSTRVRKGKEAITRWKVLERFGNATLIEARLGTGRTHQIRVHFASTGHSVVGDRTYGKKVELEVKAKKKIVFPRQMLHAELLGFTHPATGKYLEFSSPLPEDMTQKIKELRE
ncbi:MAG: RluA family pseudouridine synthase [Nitrospirota bacterium]|nr:RluA family pseudouridine synthase [Nitrospirota bacterium]MDH5767517.1 RluA family pseudouridine synthase [Nitrospirota bacterium]